MGHSLSLECDYRLEGDSLYSLKWYRDDREFFRYIPQGDHSNPDDNHNQLRLFNCLRYQMQEKMFLHLWMFIKILELHIYMQMNDQMTQSRLWIPFPSAQSLPPWQYFSCMASPFPMPPLPQGGFQHANYSKVWTHGSDVDFCVDHLVGGCDPIFHIPDNREI